MFRTDQTTAVTALPVPAGAGTPGYFTGGNPATGQAATILDADWLNMVQEELMSILAAAGIAPSKTTYTQVLSAIRVLLGQVQQSQIYRVVQKSANYAVQVSDAGTMFYAGAALTYQLPDAATTTGMVFGFMNQAGRIPTVQTTVAGQLIQGENLLGTASLALAKQGAMCVVMSDGSNYILRSASPAVWSPKVAPVFNSTSINVPAASTTYTTTVTFTAPSNGSVVATGSVNVAGTSASVLNGALLINGANTSGDSTISSQSHMGCAPILAGQTVTVTMQMTTQSTAPGVAIGMHVQAMFVPNP
ncbi:hypothetical protein [Burkholderia cenocepacia]|uniref:Uncharacterized protein n=1 Tax=Burkholderia cenocepacia TaxID=95486 RepID=A0A6B2MNK4_9BURK|nr:hypothetical protein [Burkholderia cenocepacia]NDV77133.1 hypothetical protein [Burkholderia cenocepacia]